MPRRKIMPTRQAEAFNLDTRVLHKLREWRNDMPVVRAADIATTLGWPPHQVNAALRRLERAGDVECVKPDRFYPVWACR